ncbi:glycosyltransferase family 4 protein [Candidatus Saccharibacteria bacterium]|nr:glycosyltransferase family 4 protein [Candidatus Saccharibacteria bacterium]MBR3378436.1 glycosyltransferase family 4 protein [Candidatus Saccharibacteria bacterium]
MKILMLGWELPPHNSGGLGVACLNLSKSLAKMGADIDFVVPYEAEHHLEYMKVLSAMKIDPLIRYGGAYESKEIEVKKFHNTSTKQTLSIRDIQKNYCKFVEQYLMEFKPDVVHAHDWLTYEAGILAKKQYGIPLVAHVHATEFDRGGENGGNPLIHEIEYQGLVWADKIIAVSQATKNIIVEKYKIPASKIDVAYNGWTSPNDDYHFDGSSYQYLENLKKKGYTIVSTVGRFTLQKGLFHLMRAAARAISFHPKMVFLFAGDGEQKDELMRMSADLGISQNVIFTGFIRGKQLRDIYSISDVFVMSSVSEPFGLTALEAAHHGNALIVTKQSGVGEVLHSILRYDFWDEDKLAGALVNIAESPALVDSLRDGIKHEYARISWDDVAKKCVEVYDEVRKHKRNRF